ncbi:MAG: GntR family transcriptional regulator [Turicibacter sp.]|nr:GntR family transcriptional regulator [Turicibacter sp.]
MKLVDKSSSVPLYLQLANNIEELMDEGTLAEGAFLMPERELCKSQGVSRMTVNKAVMKLVSEGRLSRHQGKGTFVTPKKEKTRYERLESLSELMAKRGITVKNDLLGASLTELPPQAISHLQMNDTLGYKIFRRRFFEDEPVVLETMYLNPDQVPGLNLDLIKDNSMYELFSHHYGHHLVRAEQTIKPIKINEEQAALFNQPAGVLALQIDRVVYTDKNQVMEYTQTIFLTLKHDFEVVFNK